MFRTIKNFGRRLSLFFRSIDKAIFRSADETVHAHSARSFWSTIVPIIFTTALFNSGAFLLLGGPQMISRIAGGDIPQIQRLDLHLQLANELVQEEFGITNRQKYRVAELRFLVQGYSSVANLPSRRETAKQFSLLAAQKQSEVATEIGRVAAFESVGFDWCQQWARAQDRADRAELETWQAAQDVAETYVIHGRNSSKTQESVHRLNREKVELLSRVAEVQFFDEKIEPIAKSEITQAQIEIESLKLKTEYTQNLMELSDEVIHMLFWLLALFGILWALRRIDRTIRRQIDRDQKVTL